jgi:hypothetical protein
MNAMLREGRVRVEWYRTASKTWLGNGFEAATLTRPAGPDKAKSGISEIGPIGALERI